MEHKYAERISNMNPSAIREILKLASGSDITSFAGGLPAPEVFPKGRVSWVAAKVLVEQGENALQYSNTEGLTELRQQIIGRMDTKMGVKGLSLENITIISGSQQGLDFTAKIFCDKGDVVFVEKPTYLAAINAFKSYEAKVVEIEMDKDGIIIDDLKKKMAKYPNAKFLYTIPDFQNPTGTSMPLKRRIELMEAVHNSNLMILEDGPYSELRYTGKQIPTLLSLDDDGRVIYLGTFSKILAPGFRIGWVIAHKDIISKFIIAKQAADLQPNTLTQYIASEFLKVLDMERHISSIIKVYGHRRDVMLKALKDYMPEGVSWTKPAGGLFLWITFPEYIDASVLLEDCIKRKVAFVPGAPFYAEHPEKNHCRMNFSFVDDDKLIEGIKNIAEAVKDYKH